MTCRILCVLTLIACGSSAGAQLSRPIGVTVVQTPVPALRRAMPDSEVVDPYLAFPARLGLGILGSVAGGYAGAYIGATTHSNCNGDECQLASAVAGAALGSSLGAAVMSSIPGLGNRCNLLQRTLLSSVGSTLGGVAGGFLGGASTGGWGVVAGYFGGAAVGGASMAMWC